MPNRTYNKISTERRQLIVDLYLQNMKIRQICDITLLPKTTVNSIIKIYKTEFRVKAKDKGGDVRSTLTVEDKEKIYQIVDDDCTLTLKEYMEKAAAVGINVKRSTMYRLINEFCYNIKLTKAEHQCAANVNATKDVYEYASEFTRCLNGVGKNKIYFINELMFSVSTRSRGGNNAIDFTSKHGSPRLKTRNLCLYTIISMNEILHIEASDTPYDQENFLSFLKSFTNHLSNREYKNCVIIMNNQDQERCKMCNEFVMQKSHRTVTLPPYSSMLNPIEKVYVEIENSVKNANAKNETELMQAVEMGIKSTLLTNFDHYFSNMIRYITVLLANKLQV